MHVAIVRMTDRRIRATCSTTTRSARQLDILAASRTHGQSWKTGEGHCHNSLPEACAKLAIYEKCLQDDGKDQTDCSFALRQTRIRMMTSHIGSEMHVLTNGQGILWCATLGRWFTP